MADVKREGFIVILIIIGLIASLYASFIGYFSVEWVLFILLISAVLFFVFRIDSRFLILAGFLCLGYCPFLLIQRFDASAETFAVFAYFFLITGVLLQVVELRFKRELKISFDKVLTDLIKAKLMLLPLLLFGLVTIISFLYDTFSAVPYFRSLRFTFLYLTILCLLLNGLVIFFKTKPDVLVRHDKSEVKTVKEKTDSVKTVREMPSFLNRLVTFFKNKRRLSVKPEKREVKLVKDKTKSVKPLIGLPKINIKKIIEIIIEIILSIILVVTILGLIIWSNMNVQP